MHVLRLRQDRAVRPAANSRTPTLARSSGHQCSRDACLARAQLCMCAAGAVQRKKHEAMQVDYIIMMNSTASSALKLPRACSPR